MNAIVNVIRAELFKLSRKRRVYVLAGFFWLLFPALLLLIGWLVQTRAGGTFLDDGTSIVAVVQAIASPFAVSRNILLLLGNSNPNLLMVTVALLVALLIGEERSHNTWKAVLTNQPNRLAVLSGKVLTIMIVLALLFLGCYASGLLIGGIGMLFLPTTLGGGWLELAQAYLLQWLFALVAVIFASLLIWLIRSLPVGIVAIFFLPGLIEGAISFYLFAAGLDRLNRINVFLEALQLRRLVETLPQYFFTSNLYAPSRQRLAELADLLGPEFLTESLFGNLLSVDLGRSVLVLLVYLLIFGGLLIWSFTRRDIA